MFGDALDIIGALDRDRERSLEQRHRRDREIAQAADLVPVPTDRAGRLQVLQRWWQQVQVAPADALPNASGHTLDRARRAGALLLFGVGLLIGALVTATALHYDGSAPVNLISVLAILVVVPGLMLLLTLLLLPGRVRGLGWLQDVLVTFSPGQWLSAWLNRRQQSAGLGWYARLDAFSNPESVALGDYRRVGKWQLVVYSQVFAVGFFLASLATLLLLVTFSDLAFGWSTTLDMDPALVGSWVEAIATPWAGLLPAAAPDAALVAQSQFYRAAEMRPEQVSGLGDWWLFLLLTITCYGLLPRLLLLLVGRWRLQRTIAQLLLGNAQVEKLFERLSAPLVLHQVDVGELDADPEPTPTNPAVADSARFLQLPDGDVGLINWNEAIAPALLPDWLQQHVRRPLAAQLALGTRTDPQQEQRALEALGADAVLVLAKAWEPPLLEFMDFAQRLKQALDPAGAVLVVPVGIDGAPATPADDAIWRQMIGRLEDVRIIMGTTS